MLGSRKSILYSRSCRCTLLRKKFRWSIERGNNNILAFCVDTVTSINDMIVDRLQIQCHFYFKTRYYWPDEKSTEDGGVVESGSVHVKVLNQHKEKCFILSVNIIKITY